jgi:multifunctional methyltransferase subunit TRM112
MKLLTHNMLRCNKKGVSVGFPLRIEAGKTEVRETEKNPAFLRSIAGRLDWGAFVGAAGQLGIKDLPPQLSEEQLADDAFLERFHHALLETVVVEGTLVCPESGRRFPIKNSIPNMLLNEDEV